MSDLLDPDDFDTAYKARMILAYPTIAGMNSDEFFYSTLAEKDEAFDRILANRHLRRTHELYLGVRAYDQL